MSTLGPVRPWPPFNLQSISPTLHPPWEILTVSSLTLWGEGQRSPHSLSFSFLLQTLFLTPQTLRPSRPPGGQWAAVAGPGAGAFGQAGPLSGPLSLGLVSSLLL